MKILAISDYHGSEDVLDRLRRLIDIEKPDVIVFCGDVVKGTARGTEWLTARKENRTPNRNIESIIQEKDEDIKIYEKFYNSLRMNIPVLVVPGNMDAPEKRYFSVTLNQNIPNIHLIHGNIFCMNDFIFTGFGGEITDNEEETFFVMRYPAEKVKFMMKWIKYSKKQKILVFHTPPHSKVGQEGDKVIGSYAINEIIDSIQPKILLCGHAHHAQGIDTIGNTLCINPGPLKYKNAVIIDTENLNVNFLSV